MDNRKNVGSQVPKRRRAIPKAIRETVLAESRLSCAICELPFALDLHHIRYYSLGGTDKPGNLLAVCPRCHRLIHQLNVSTSILRQIKEKWTDYGYAGKNFLALYQYLQGLCNELKQDPTLSFYIPLLATTGWGAGVPKAAANLVGEWVKSGEPSQVLVILGEMGSGKTTFLRRLAQTQAEEFLKAPSTSLYPIVVYLKTFARAPTFADVLEETLRRHGLSLDQFSDLSRHVSCLLLLDGFDEANDSLRKALSDSAFEEITRSVPAGTRTIITSRSTYFVSRDAEVSRFTMIPREQTGLTVHGIAPAIIHLSPFGTEEIDSYLQMRVPAEWKAARQFIDNNYDLSDICHRPIMLAMFAELYPELVGDPGRTKQAYTRAWLYEEYVSRWLQREIIQKNRDINVTNMMTLFEEIGFDLVERSYGQTRSFE